MFNTQQLVTIGIPIGGLVFYAGIQSQRIDELFTKSHAQAVEQKETKDIIFDMHGKVCSIEKDIKHILDKVENP